MRILAILIALCATAYAQNTVTWSKVWPTGGGPFNGPNGYEDVRYDSWTKKTWMYTTNGGNSGQQIYSILLHYFNSATPADTNIGQNGQTVAGGCLSSTSIWPNSHHGVGQLVIDEVRHRFISLEGTGCATVSAEMWYYQLTNPPDAHATWVQMLPAHIPIAATQGLGRSTLSGSLTSGATTMTVANAAGYGTNQYAKIDSEIVRITSGDGTFGGGTGTNPLTISRAQYGTTAAAHSSGVNAFIYEGLFHSSAMVHDTDDDVFILFGMRVDTSFGALWIYCDTSVNPTPGTLTAAQSGAGCTNADDWTDITSKSICAGAGCAAATTGTNGPNSGKVPHGWYYPSLDYDKTNHKVVTWAGGVPTPSSFNTAYTYSPSTFTWTQLTTTCSGANCTSNGPPVQSTNSEHIRVAHAMAGGKLYYHLTLMVSGGGFVTPQDWVLDLATNQWTETQTGVGPNYGETMTYNADTNSLVFWGFTSIGNTNAEVWNAQIPTPPTITNPASAGAITAGTQNSTYTFTFAASGTTPLTWSITSGAPPTGISLNSSTGVLSGTPTASGTFSFTISVTNGYGSPSTQADSLTIAPVCLITSTTMPSGKFNVPYSQTVPTAGCTSPVFTKTSGTLPTGLTLHTGTGVIDGTPTGTGLFNFTIGVADAAGNPSQAYGITIIPGPGVLNVLGVSGLVYR